MYNGLTLLLALGGRGGEDRKQTFLIERRHVSVSFVEMHV